MYKYLGNLTEGAAEWDWEWEPMGIVCSRYRKTAGVSSEHRS